VPTGALGVGVSVMGAKAETRARRGRVVIAVSSYLKNR
jgi:hypothetical protein